MRGSSCGFTTHPEPALTVVLIFFGSSSASSSGALNQKAMRANLQLQAVQPLMKEIQDKYK